MKSLEEIIGLTLALGYIKPSDLLLLSHSMKDIAMKNSLLNGIFKVTRKSQLKELALKYVSYVRHLEVCLKPTETIDLTIFPNLKRLTTNCPVYTFSKEVKLHASGALVKENPKCISLELDSFSLEELEKVPNCKRLTVAKDSKEVVVISRYFDFVSVQPGTSIQVLHDIGELISNPVITYFSTNKTINIDKWKADVNEHFIGSRDYGIINVNHLWLPEDASSIDMKYINICKSLRFDRGISKSLVLPKHIILSKFSRVTMKIDIEKVAVIELVEITGSYCISGCPNLQKIILRDCTIQLEAKKDFVAKNLKNIETHNSTFEIHDLKPFPYLDFI